MRYRNPSASHTWFKNLKRIRCHTLIVWPMGLRGDLITGIMITLVALLLPALSDISVRGAAHGGTPPSIGLPHWHLVRAGSPIAEPYPALHGGSFSGRDVKWSPDPLVAYRWAHLHASDGLQTYVLRPVAVSTATPKSFSNLQSVTRGHCDITVKGTGAFRVDFGTESAAWIEFDSPDLNGSKVEMGISEFNAPAHDGILIARGGCAPAIAVPERMGNTYRLKLNPQYYEGVRFGWIYVRSFSGTPWHITAVRAICQIKPTNYNGSFSCSDSMLTRIWYTGAYTVKLNLLKNYFGAILMDRGDRISWVGDAHIAQSTAMAAFGNFSFVKRNLNISAGNGNGIASYYLYWVLSLVDYYRYTGDRAELQRYCPLVEKLLANAAANFEHPHIAFYGWGDRLGGFAGAENPQSREAYRMLFVETCRRFAWATGEAGNKTLQARYAELADQYAAKIQSKPDWMRTVNIYPASDGINAGVPTPAQQRVLYRRCFADRLDRLAYSPFNEYFVVEAMARMHLWDQAMETVLDDWGGQINYGGTTFFEVYRPSWNNIIPTNGGIPSTICGVTSLCHPWSSGCTTWLTQWVAGIRPMTPGFATVDIVPHLGRTLTWVKATTPTPHGTISESLHVNRGIGTFIIPDGIVAKIGVPKVGRSITAITINGHHAWHDGRFTACPGIGDAMQSRNFVYFTGVQAGKYTMVISYRGHTPPFLHEPFIYPVQVLGQDSVTQGDWGGVYGHDGYVLFADSTKEANIEHLPSYVLSVHCLWGHKTQWPSNGSDPRALAPSPQNGRNHRIAGVFYSDLTSQGPQAAVDIRLKHPRNYRLALFAVDFDHKNRKEVITIEDLRTKKLLTPVQAFSHFSGGKYMVFECHGSVRIRFDPIRGGNAVLSGIFFDPPGG
ncbi:MAG: alpha-L-rhamnosidase C-terminal domain-containing protein [Phycisphaerae bacterium]